MASKGSEEQNKVKSNAENSRIDPDSLAGISASILNDCLFNIIHDIVLKTHCEEKILRMSTAAINAQQAAAAQCAEPETPVKGGPPSIPSGRAETVGAVYDNGKVYLKGNPLRTTREILCPRCKFPRLLYPTSGVGARPLPEPGKQYCGSHPFVTRTGHDIYGNAFPTDAPKKKERELLKTRQASKDNTPGSQEGLEGAEVNGAVKKGVHYPWHTCPNCKRSLLITRFAQHLEKCLGIAGRQSSRNAMARMSSQNGNTPIGSRAGTPQPGGVPNSKNGTAKRKAQPDSDDDEDSRKAKKKKLVRQKSKQSDDEDDEEIKVKKTKTKAARPKGPLGMSALGKAAKAQTENRPPRSALQRQNSRKDDEDGLVKVKPQHSTVVTNGVKDGNGEVDGVAEEDDA